MGTATIIFTNNIRHLNIYNYHHLFSAKLKIGILTHWMLINLDFYTLN